MPSAPEPLRGISSMATKDVLAERAAAYARETGQPVAIESVGGVDAAKRVASGEAFDVVFLAAAALEKLASAGHVDAASQVEVARTGIAIAVRAGAPHPDVGNEAALRDAVLAARSVGYSTGPSGDAIAALFRRWRIAPQVVIPPPGTGVGGWIAEGRITLGFQQLSELVGVAGIEIVGALPEPLQVITVFRGAVARTSRRAEAAREFLEWLQP